MTMEQIREELKDVRYYYMRQELFESTGEKTGRNKVVKLVARYNRAICDAPPILYDLYGCMYVRNLTQESASREMHYSPEYIRSLHRQLLQFFQKRLSYQGEKK